MGIIGSCVESDGEKDFHSTIPALTTSKFNEIIDDNKPCLVHFYVTYGEGGDKCKDFDQQIRHAHNHLEKEFIDLRLYRVNCVAEQELNDRCGI
mmetsp:Transcript_17361/g.15274  ORF Transcript_17361/g.15274 Transcript_17361/m.15274 type:complete len:94 (+) Transcript_17361:89-370(+)